MNWQRNPILCQLRARPRLVLVSVFGILLYFALPFGLAVRELAIRDATRFLISWNAAVCLYLLLAGVMMARSSREKIRLRSLHQDDGRRTVLLLVVITVLASLLAIVDELSVVKNLSGPVRLGHIALTALTVVMSWVFTHLMFAIHYAHDYYLNVSRGQPTGLVFPGEDAPDYGDFLYFAGVIGTSGQTADVSLTSRSMRRMGLIHCVLSFFFNTAVLALTINIAASLLQG
jgi:uncharacterized membrane protein